MSLMPKFKKAAQVGPIDEFFLAAENIVFGKETELRHMVCTLLARGHLLIEDVPGVGKTTFVKTMAALTGLAFNRVQFTNDLLPADIVGGSMIDPASGKLSFHKGPIFCELLLADEINRSTPKTQSACLQAMEEHQVTVDGATHDLPQPFFVVATQNPTNSIGTFPLPESQLDRFLMRIKIGFPDRDSERQLLTNPSRQSILAHAQPVLQPETIRDLQKQVEAVTVSDPIIDYVQDLVAATRHGHLGLSPRAALDLLAAAKAWAMLEGRGFVTPEDVQAVAVPVMNHRIGGAETTIERGRELAQQILSRVPVK